MIMVHKVPLILLLYYLILFISYGYGGSSVIENLEIQVDVCSGCAMGPFGNIGFQVNINYERT